MTKEKKLIRVHSGIPELDQTIDELRLGDNVVWKIDDLNDYRRFSAAFFQQAIKDKRKCIYMRFAPHEPILEPQPGIEIVEVDPSSGFDTFSSEVHTIIEKKGEEALYVFDNLSALVEEWATDELLAAFFQVTCPYLYELDTVAYFALTRGKHSAGCVVRIRDTTQVLLSVFNVKGEKYVHPLKVWQRYSSQMFLPHRIENQNWQPLFQSTLAAEVSEIAVKNPLNQSMASIAPWDNVHRKLLRFQEKEEPLSENIPEIKSLKQEFARMMLGSHPTFNRLVDQFLTLDDLMQIRSRLIGSGKIGGKAAGMLVARRILMNCEKNTFDFNDLLDSHDSFYIGSDVFFTFLIDNNLFRLRMQLSQKTEYSDEDYQMVVQRFLDGNFSTEIIEQFRNVLHYFGQAPIIVRSSSLLEDSFGNAFAGKYLSEFCANQGSDQQRLDDFIRNVKLIYASSLSPDALSYRKKRGLADRDEQMGILVQRVAGQPYKDYFFPSVAGVAMSRNLYVWTKRIRPEKGMVRLVFGLGTRAVNRVSSDYPRMIAISAPQLRPESHAQIPKYSQKSVDVLNLKENCLETHLITDVVDSLDYPFLHFFVSEMEEGHISESASSMISISIDKLIFTFNPLINRGLFVNILDKVLAELERVYRQPVEIEFTLSIIDEDHIKLNLLQCRPMGIVSSKKNIEKPKSIKTEHILFETSRFLGAGVAQGIQFIVYVDSKAYGKIEDLSRKKSLGRVVGVINNFVLQKKKKFIIIGPGRWGSSNISLGVNVSYADISNASALVEMDYEQEGHVPEVSYGTHFFLDLVESQIVYLAVNPGEDKSYFNQKFIDEAENVLGELLPLYNDFSDVVKLIDVKRAADQMGVKIVVDSDHQKAVCYLAKQ